MLSYETIRIPELKIEEIKNEQERHALEVICRQLSEKIANLQDIDDVEELEAVLKKAINSGMIKIMYDQHEYLFLHYYSLALGRYIDPQIYLLVEFSINN